LAGWTRRADPCCGRRAAPASAVEVPNNDYTKTFSIQTNGPNAAIGLGDYYSATTGQGGAGTNHVLKLNVPCSWPANKDTGCGR